MLGQGVFHRRSYCPLTALLGEDTRSCPVASAGRPPAAFSLTGHVALSPGPPPAPCELVCSTCASVGPPHFRGTPRGWGPGSPYTPAPSAPASAHPTPCRAGSSRTRTHSVVTSGDSARCPAQCVSLSPRTHSAVSEAILRASSLRTLPRCPFPSWPPRAARRRPGSRITRLRRDAEARCAGSAASLLPPCCRRPTGRGGASPDLGIR